ncbi:MAG: alkaline phosphatase D family protein [Hyphomonadaceae bacterium]|nr:alkaline phosphatase D family protein [Hyphomonadaceae bacterium]
MTRLTRRGALGFGVAGLGAAACTTTGEGAAYAGKAAFGHGVASGDPTQTAVILWTRVTPDAAGPVPVMWSIATDAAFKNVVKKGVFTTGPERDYTVKVDVDGLEAGQVYYYWFTAGQASSPAGVTRTLPASGVADYRMAVVSCSNFPFGYFNAYREIAKRGQASVIDAVIHLGDYIYEYGATGYGGVVGKELGRNHEPSTEIVTLADYRVRHAQYKADPDLQAAHAIAPWFCTWDDHESTNNSYRTGAENHQPETEGDWTVRKAAAVQAYLEWMPVRDPVAGRAREAIWRKFDIGDLATLFLLESRLVGRGEDLTFDEIFIAADVDRPPIAERLKAKINDPNRTMLGLEQEAWLAEGLKQSTASNRKWQVLGNQVTMAKVKMPDLQTGLSAEQYAKVPQGSRRYYGMARYGFEWNLDSWCGYPQARERLYAAAKAANARLVTLTGDTHTGWANQLHDYNGQQRGVEFGCTSVTSPGAGDNLPFEELNWLMPEANNEVLYYNAFAKGFTLLTLKADQVEAEFVKVSNIRSRDYFASTDARFIARQNEVGGMGGLQKIMGGSLVTSG